MLLNSLLCVFWGSHQKNSSLFLEGNQMNRIIGYYSATINILSVTAFAIGMLIPSTFMSYLSSIFIAISFIPMICSYLTISSNNNRTAAYTSIAFAIIYAVFIFIVYFAQVTIVRNNGLSSEALKYIDYSKFGLYFNYNLLGYGFMALSTFFIGLTIVSTNSAGKLLKALLMFHGIFFISGFTFPIFNLFNEQSQGNDIIGKIILEFWCIYFLPIGILSLLYFRDHKEKV
jgi:hypothetical protein